MGGLMESALHQTTMRDGSTPQCWLQGQARSSFQLALACWLIGNVQLREAPSRQSNQDQSASSITKTLSIERYAVDRARAADAADEEEFLMDAIR
ncbi:MAG: hypothetical protein M1815_005967 [Lichina confinis]|nr:MAG: hypothetical protein M1815_005967 [Lichina confinis]